MAPIIVDIHFLHPERKVKSDFGLRGDGFLNSLLSSVFLTAILFSLSTEGGP